MIRILSEIRSKLGSQMLLLLSGILVSSMCLLAYLSISTLNDFGRISAAQNEKSIRARANGFMKRVAHEKALRYESVFNQYAQASAIIANQAAHLLDHADIYNIAETPANNLVRYPENGIFSTGKESNIMGLFWGEPEMGEQILHQIKATSHIDPILGSIIESHPQASAGYIVTEEGSARYYPNRYGVQELPPVDTFDIRDAAWYVTARPENNPEQKTIWTNIYRDSVGQGLMITASSPIYGSGGAFLGVSGVDLTLDTMVTELLKEVIDCEQVEQMFTFLMDNKGRLIAFPSEQLGQFSLTFNEDELTDASVLLEFSILESANPDIRRLGREILDSPQLISNIDMSGQKYLISSHHMPSTKWWVAIVIPESNLLASIRQTHEQLDTTVRNMRLRFVALTVLFLTLALLAGYHYLKRRLIVPLSMLTEGLTMVKSGDLTTRISLRTENEFGFLAQTFNTMVDSLQKAAGKENEYTRELEQRVQERTTEISHKNRELRMALRTLEQEIIKRQVIQEELVASEESIRNIVENATNLFYSHTPSHKITYISPQSHDFLQCSPEEAKILWTEFATDHPCNLKGVEVTERAIATGQKQPPYELELKGKNGKVIMVEVREAPIVKNGKTVAIVGSLTDISERKRAEAILENEKRFLDDLLEAVPVSICVKNAKGVFISCNRAYANASGKTVEEIVGSSNEEIYPPSLARSFSEQDKQTIESGRSLSFEMDGADMTGTEKAFQFIKTPFHGLKGESTGIISVGLDITERKEREDRLQRLKMLLDEAQQVGRIGSYELDEPNRTTLWSDNHYRLFGLEPGEVDNPYNYFRKSVIFSDEKDKFVQSILNLYEKRQTVSVEYRARHKDGHSMIMQSIATPMLNEQGEVKIVYGMTQDITERKKAEQALIDSERRYRSMFDFSPVAIWVLDLSTIKSEITRLAAIGITNLRAHLENNYEQTVALAQSVRFLDMNPAGHDLYEADSIEQILPRLKELFSINETLQIFIESLTHLNETGVGSESLLSISTLKNSARVLRIKSVIVPGYEDDWSRVLVSQVDVTEILQAQQDAEKANKTKSIFLANMSHDLRTPINGVMGVLQVLESGIPENEKHHYIAMGIDSCRRLTGLLSDILDITKIEAGMLTLSPRQFSLAGVFTELETMFERQPGAKNRLLQSCCDQIPDTLFGDDHRLLQILTNLISNGFKFSTDGAVSVNAEVTWCEDNRLILLFTVSDSGSGIAEEKIPTLFNVFTQADSDSARQGSGLGLAIVKNLTLLMDGGICVESTEGAGTTIYLHLPFSALSKVSETRVTPVTDSTKLPAKPFTALVVEDDPISRVVLSSMLETMGGTVDQAATGSAGLEMILANEYNLVFMDIQLPDMDGLEVTARIRKEEQAKSKTALPIIAMTATAMAGDREKCLEAGMTDYISKPVESKALHEALVNYAIAGKGEK